ncbi:MAG: helix-turn-helix domain-containing protein [Alistipes senegalensis]|nr:helix-turn-helix domain-containing protein [Bacteroides cellulosilyticus]MCM1351330.1 helix-turn-helix domain-containing protein [Alistipes senegalensis]
MQEESEKIIHRLKKYVDSKGISLNQIAVEIGVSNSYFSKMLKNSGSMGEDIVRKILLFYEDINVEWFVTGNGDMLKQKSKDTKQGIEINEFLVQALADANETILLQQKQLNSCVSVKNPPPSIGELQKKSSVNSTDE